MTQPFSESGQQPSTGYDRAAEFAEIHAERDVPVAMRDGVRIVVDVYRPAVERRFPVLLAFGGHSKELQGPDVTRDMPPQPAWSSLWVGHFEAGDTRYFVSRGYVHVIGSPRGMHKSGDGGSREWDSFDLVEWIVRQPWCDGNVGMVGIGAFAAEQLKLAKQRCPHLKAIFAYDGRGLFGPLGSFREEYPGGVLHLLRYLMDHFSGVHGSKGAPPQLDAERESLWRTAMANADYRMYPHVLNVLQQKGQHIPHYFQMLIDPYDRDEWVTEGERGARAIDIPVFLGSGWYAYTYKTHVSGAENYFAAVRSPKRLLFTGPAHLDRPLRALRSEMLRWYDHWLKGLPTDLESVPPVRYWTMGSNEWRAAENWPPPGVVWTPLYLHGWERLSSQPLVAASGDDSIPADAFLQMPPTQTNRIDGLRYLSDPLGRDTLIAGPSVLHLFAAIDQPDTNWIVILKDVGPAENPQTAREGERNESRSVPEREITRGWLKASHRALDPRRSRPGRPWHPLTRERQQAVTPGEIHEYAIELLATANLFKRGHRICIEITSADLPTGVSGATNVEYIPNHICSSCVTVHRVFHDPQHPSHLLLPIIPG